jgi:quercetin dioxygenase-like cupin family protein
MTELRLERFDSPDEVREFEKGRFELIRIGGTTVGRATYEPGWKWSEHVGPTAGTDSCQVEHVGLVVSGRAAVRMDDGTERVMKEGDLFYVPPATTAGWSATSPMSRSTSSARTNTRRTRPRRGDARARGARASR